MNTALNRTTIAYLTNKSGGALTYGAVVVLDNTNANGFTTTATAGLSTRGLGVVFDVAGIANNATGAVAIGGWCPQVNLNTASTVGQFIKTHTVAGQGTPHSSPQAEGDFAVALDASATPSALLFGGPNPPIGSGTVTNTGTLTNDTVILGNAGADITSLANGTAGQVLTMNAGATAPEWAAASGGGGLVLLEQHTASASASLNFTTCISATYDEYMIEFVNILPATNGQDLVMRLGNGSFDSGANYTRLGWYNGTGDVFTSVNTTGQTSILVASSVRNSANKLTLNGSWKLFNPAATAAFKQVGGSVLSFAVSDNNLYRWDLSGAWNSLTAADRFQFLFASGNVASGTIRVYGLEK